MQLSIITLFAALTSAALAIPVNRVNARDGCDAASVASCAAALGPAAGTCAGAALEAGANVIADGGCIVTALNDALNIPKACQPCAEQFGVTKAIDSAKKETSNIAGEVKDTFTSIF